MLMRRSRPWLWVTPPLSWVALWMTLCLGSIAGLSAQQVPAQQDPLLTPLSDGKQLELPALRDDLPHPSKFLGYPLGRQFTHHHQILAYLEALAAASDRVRLESYGRSYEGRHLSLLTVTSPALQARLGELRLSQLRLADSASLSAEPAEESLADQPIVVWLAYGVHGNESSSPEAALATAYVLAAAEGELAELLERVIVIIDPVVNPDGRERYVHGYETKRGHRPNTDPVASEHWESWPGGRQNHYLIDLNRDWAWLTQIETRQRLEAYRRWEPQVYVDFHEMSKDSTYFFPPPAEPINAEIDPRLLAWSEVFGRQNAAAFDRQGWVYYMGEVYDLFYPGYGDAYPSLRGAVGMTYEMAGGGTAGLAVELADGRTLTLADRIARHYTAGLATIRTAAMNRQKMLEDFVASRRSRGPLLSYFWRAEQSEGSALSELLQRHGLRVETLGTAQTLEVEPLLGGGRAEQIFPAGTQMVSADQPQGNLLRALMEPEVQGISAAFIEKQRQRLETAQESEFYDITAWSLPLAFNLQVWRFAGRVESSAAPTTPEGAGVQGSGEVGFLIPPSGLAGYRLAAALQKEGARLRLSLTELENGGQRFAKGTLFVPTAGNRADLPERVAELVAKGPTKVTRVSTSYSASGGALGSEQVVPLAPRRVGLLSGDGVVPTSFGFVWHLLDQEIRMPFSRLDLAQLGRVDLQKLDVLVLPEGDYERALPSGGDRSKALASWARAGGTLVAIGGAFEWLRREELTAVRAWEPAGESEESSDQELGRRELKIPGVILATELAAHSVLAAGIESAPPQLFFGSRVLLPTGDPQKDVLTVRKEAPILGGFLWPEAEERLRGALLVSVERADQGKVVIFAQEPAFRLFWRGTMPLFLNALMYEAALIR